jgi:vacuolar-type H+-ATPase subunit F/Vma7
VLGRVAVIGEAVRVEGFTLAGATVLVAEDADAVRRTWASLPGDVAVVLLTAKAAAALAEEATLREGVLSAVMPS